MAVLIGHLHMIRECGRQCVFPGAEFRAPTKPFGTYLGPYFIKWLATLVVSATPLAGDAFNFGKYTCFDDNTY